MPYRRLPNTDRARLRAMKKALEMQDEEIEIVIPYPQRVKLQEVANDFDAKLSLKNLATKNRINQNKNHFIIASKARMYLSHFLQVINMSISRGELNEETRTFYGIDREEHRLPDFSSDELFLEWAEKVVQGEHKRMTSGVNRISNPSIALVAIHLDKFRESYKKGKLQQKIEERANNDLSASRGFADEAILKLWNTLEEHFTHRNENIMREKCAKWGISYVYRQAELKKIREEEYARSISPSLEF